jgi:hypothetical protein
LGRAWRGSPRDITERERFGGGRSWEEIVDMKLVPFARAVGLTAAATLAACSNASEPASPAATVSGNHVLDSGVEPVTVGSVGMRVVVAAGLHMSQFSWAISNGTNEYAGTAFMAEDAGYEAQSDEFVAGGVALGSGYVATLSGRDTFGDSCQGASTQVTVGPGQKSDVTVLVTCTVATDGAGPALIHSGVVVDAGVELVLQADDAGDAAAQCGDPAGNCGVVLTVGPVGAAPDSGLPCY